MKLLMVIDDDDEMVLLVKYMLSVDPALEIVGEAHTAQEALDAASSFDPDLIILDYHLGEAVTGLDVAPLLRANAPHAKILMFSNCDVAKEAAREPAVDGFLGKHRIRELLPTVRRLLDLATTS